MTYAEHIVKLREALYAAETVMMIVEPRSHKAEYLEILGKVREALALPSSAESPQPGEVNDEMVERAARQIAPVIWTVVDKFSSRCGPEYKGTVGEDWNTPLYDWPGTQKNKNKSLETARAALQAALKCKFDDP